MNKSESIKALAGAMAKAQGEIENASKNAANPHFKSRYADLAEVLNTVRPIFSKHGLSVTQSPGFADGIASVETMLMHESGEWLSSVASAPVSKQDAQGVGSALTYLRRYSLAAVAGIAQEDDDANSSVGGKPKAAPQKAPAKPAISPEGLDMATSTLRACNTLQELKETFVGLPPHVREAVEGVKNEMKSTLERAA